MEDDLNFFLQMEDSLNILLNGRWPHFPLQMEEDLNLFQIEDNLNKNNATKTLTGQNNGCGRAPGHLVFTNITETLFM